MFAHYYYYEDPFDTLIRMMSENESVERGLKHVTTMQSSQCDPIIREMAIAVLHEIKRMRKQK